jgi:hypothetical protein
MKLFKNYKLTSDVGGIASFKFLSSVDEDASVADDDKAISSRFFVTLSIGTPVSIGIDDVADVGLSTTFIEEFDGKLVSTDADDVGDDVLFSPYNKILSLYHFY